MKLFLHIGSGKTGSTSIQHVLSKNAPGLLKQGFYYPDIDLQRKREIHNHNILSLPVTRRVPREFYQRLGRDFKPALRISKKKWTRLGKLVEKIAPSNIVLSSEYLFLGRNLKPLTKIIGRFLPKVTEIEIICYLRDPREFYVSNLQQTIKASGKISLPTPPTYFDAVNRWDDIGTLNLRHFSRSKFVKSDLICDFLHQLSPSINTEGIDIPPRRNETFSAEGMSILQEYRKIIFPNKDNEFKPCSNALLKYIRHCEDELGKFDFFSRPKLLPEISEYIRSQSSDAEQVRQHYGLDFGYQTEPSSAQIQDVLQPSKISDVIFVDEQKKTLLYHNILALILQNPDSKGIK